MLRKVIPCARLSLCSVSGAAQGCKGLRSIRGAGCSPLFQRGQDYSLFSYRRAALAPQNILQPRQNQELQRRVRISSSEVKTGFLTHCFLKDLSPAPVLSLNTWSANVLSHFWKANLYFISILFSLLLNRYILVPGLWFWLSGGIFWSATHLPMFAFLPIRSFDVTHCRRNARTTVPEVFPWDSDDQEKCGTPNRPKFPQNTLPGLISTTCMWGIQLRSR